MKLGKTNPKNIAIAVLAGVLGIAAIYLIVLYQGGGPAGTDQVKEMYEKNEREIDAKVKEAAAKVAPVFDWTEGRSEKFVLPVGAMRIGDTITSPRPQLPLKLEINAKSPVTVAFVPFDYRNSFQEHTADVLRQADIACLQTNVLQTSVTCNLSTPLDTTVNKYFLVILDQRSASEDNQAGAAVLGALGYKEPMKEQLTRNDVSYSYSLYTCVKNCGN